MRKLMVMLAIGLTATLLGACGNKTAAASTSTSAAVPGAVVKVSTADSVGVPACDEYLKKYTECIDSKVPDAARAQYRAGIAQTIAGWKQIAATPGGKDGLTAACTQAEAAAKQAMTSFGCSF